jgi:hypothetical protein
VAWASRFRQLAGRLREPRPDVAAAISTALASFQVPARISWLADLHERGGDTRQVAQGIVDAFGAGLVPGLVALLDERPQPANMPAIVTLMCDHARVIGPALAPRLAGRNPAATRAIIKALGFAGPGQEAALDAQLAHADEQTSREALRALARIGTLQAATIVARQLQSSDDKRRAAAEEALWHLPAARIAGQVRQLLADREFVMRHPEVASRLLARATPGGADGLDQVLAELEPLRFRFWNPGLARVGLKARELRLR